MAGFDLTSGGSSDVLVLAKDENLNLTKDHYDLLEESYVAVQWDEASDGSRKDIDIVLFARSNGVIKSVEDVLYFNTKNHDPITKERVHASGAMRISPDNRTGRGEGDDEYAKIRFNELDKVRPDIDEIFVIAHVYEGGHFGAIKNAAIRLCEGTPDNEKIRYDLREDASGYRSLIFVRFYKRKGDWKVEALGTGHKGDLNELAKEYGLGS